MACDILMLGCVCVKVMSFLGHDTDRSWRNWGGHHCSTLGHNKGIIDQLGAVQATTVAFSWRKVADESVSVTKSPRSQLGHT